VARFLAIARLLSGRPNVSACGHSLHPGGQGRGRRDLATALRHTAQTIEMVPGDRSEWINRLRFGNILDRLPKLTLLRSCSSILTSCEFTPEDERILVAMSDGRCELLNAETGAREALFQAGTNGVLAAAISADGSRVGTASKNNLAHVWDARSGRIALVLPHPDEVTAICFSPSGPLIATGCADGFVRLWDSSGARLREVRAHTQRIGCVEFSHRGDFLASGGRDRLVKFWRVDSLERPAIRLKLKAGSCTWP